MDYVFSDKTKKITLSVAAVGFLLFLLGIVIGPKSSDYSTLWYINKDGVKEFYGVAQRIWVAILTNGIFFFFISLSMLFFVALQYAAEVSWSVVFKRIYEAMMSVLPWMTFVIVVVLLAGQFGHMHHIYHWMSYNSDWTIEDVEFDKLLDHKSLFFEPYFFWPVLLFFLGSFIFLKKGSPDEALGPARTSS